MRRTVLLASALVSAGAGCSTLDDPTAAAPSFLTVQAASDTMAADGVRLNVVAATLLTEAPDTFKVTFTTQAGTFSNNTNTITVQTVGHKAQTVLMSTTKAQPVIVTVAVGSTQAFDTVKFVPAPPDSMTLSPDRVSTTADGTASIALTATLRRLPGHGDVTVGTLVRFSVVDSATNAELPEQRREVLTGADNTAITHLSSVVAGVYRIFAVATASGVTSDTLVVRFH